MSTSDLKTLFSSKSDNYWTPKEFFKQVNITYGPFDIDVAASDDNHLCDIYFTKESDGLSQDWNGVVWCNPPYGREIKKWLVKAITEIDKGNCKRAVFLIPARTDTKWMHDLVWVYASEIIFIEGRQKFDNNSPYTAPFPSMLVVFDKEHGISPEVGVWKK